MRFEKPYKTQYLRMFLRTKGFGKKLSVVKHALKCTGSIVVAPHPLYVKLEINRTCNCRCVECVRLKLDNHHQVMNFETFKTIIGHLDSIIEIMPYGFGEPLLHPQFFEMMEYTNKKKIRLSLVSNFTLMTKEMGIKVLNLRPATVRVSIDGVGEVFEKIRRGAKFDKVIHNIKTFKHFIDERNQKVDFQMNATIWRDNIDQIIPLTQLAKEIGIPICFTNISTACMFGECVPNNCISSNQDLLKQTRSLMVKATELYDRVTYNIEQPETRTCQRQWDSVYIDYKGDVYTCTNNIEDEDILGNIITQDISEIFNGEKYRRMRARSVLGYTKISCPTCMAYGPLPRSPKETEVELFEIAQIDRMESKFQDPTKRIAKN